MNNISIHIYVVLLPLIISNVIHMIIVKQNIFSFSNYPLWEKAFGNNKTWRGFIFLPLMNAAILFAMDKLFQTNIINPILLGFLLGLAYILFELPNSFFKRRLNIMPGQQHKKYTVIFSIMDKTDSAFGVALVYMLLGFVTYKVAAVLFLINAVTHATLSLVLVNLKLKANF